MLLEVREVSRKTPRDGRLEITEETARRLAVFGVSIPVEVDVQRGEGALEVMACQCEKGGGSAGHTHHFVRSPLFESLDVGETIVLELLEGPVLAVARPHPLRPEP